MIIQAGVALGACLELVVEVDDELRQRHLVRQQDALLVDVFHFAEAAAPRLDELHHRPDIAAGRNDRKVDPGLLDAIESAR